MSNLNESDPMKDYVEQYLEAKRLVIEQNRPTCQKRFFQYFADKFLAFAEEKLTEKELKVASGILKGKPLPEIGAEMGCSGDSIRLCWHKIEPVLLEQIDFPAYRNDNKTLSDDTYNRITNHIWFNTHIDKSCYRCRC